MAAVEDGVELAELALPEVAPRQPGMRQRQGGRRDAAVAVAHEIEIDRARRPPRSRARVRAPTRSPCSARSSARRLRCACGRRSSGSGTAAAPSRRAERSPPPRTALPVASPAGARSPPSRGRDAPPDRRGWSRARCTRAHSRVRSMTTSRVRQWTVEHRRAACARRRARAARREGRARHRRWPPRPARDNPAAPLRRPSRAIAYSSR